MPKVSLKMQQKTLFRKWIITLNQKLPGLMLLILIYGVLKLFFGFRIFHSGAFSALTRLSFFNRRSTTSADRAAATATTMVAKA